MMKEESRVAGGRINNKKEKQNVVKKFLKSVALVMLWLKEEKTKLVQLSMVLWEENLDQYQIISILRL